MDPKKMPDFILLEHPHLYSVGEVCSLTQVTRKTLFYYDRIGLLKPTARTKTQKFKLYDIDQLNRLGYILVYRDAGLSIHEIKTLLDDEKAGRLKIMENALERLEDEKNEKDEQISNLQTLIGIEKREYEKHSIF